jgi:transposase
MCRRSPHFQPCLLKPAEAGGQDDIGQTGHAALVPPYSPDFNPIENAFAKLKALLRKAAARTIDALWNAIRDALPAFTADECANYFTASGYEPE